MTDENFFPEIIHIWFPYYPSANVQPALWEIIYDKKAENILTRKLPINLQIPIPLNGPDPGPILLGLYRSPNSRWLAADFAYSGSQLIDLQSGNTKELDNNFKSSYWKFLAWVDTDPPTLVASDQEYPNGKVQSVNLSTGLARPITFPEVVDENSSLRVMTSTADEEKVAIGVVLPSEAGTGQTEKAIVRLEGSEKRELAVIDGGVSFVDQSLQWSPDRKKLIWIVKIVKDGGESETQLWIGNFNSGEFEILDILAKSVQFNAPAVWSPDGSSIAFLKTEVNSQDQRAEENAYLINLVTGEEKQITHFSGLHLSNLQWLPDGKWLAFTVPRENYGEIWMTNLDGSIISPIAGPTLPNAPFLITTKGE